jgi:hypothetical protein
MPEPAPNVELMRSLGRLVRGLSALFWGLPLALVVCVWTANPQWMRVLGIVPPLACTGLLLYGLTNLGAFQPQERIWQNALDRARILALINCGLSPFLYWWSRVPAHPFLTAMVLLLALSSLLFLVSLNLVLQRLGAILPDESLRHDIRQFTALSLNLLLVTLVCAAAYLVVTNVEVAQFQKAQAWMGMMFMALDRHSPWLLVMPMVLVLLPVAMTMALLWKTKEVILENVFGPKG